MLGESVLQRLSKQENAPACENVYRVARFLADVWQAVWFDLHTSSPSVDLKRNVQRSYIEIMDPRGYQSIVRGFYDSARDRISDWKDAELHAPALTSRMTARNRIADTIRPTRSRRARLPRHYKLRNPPEKRRLKLALMPVRSPAIGLRPAPSPSQADQFRIARARQPRRSA
jgi:hypothetical protein